MEFAKIKAIVFDGQTIEMKEIDNSVDGFHKVIGCDTYEGYSGTELGHLYGLDVYLDGNGKIRDDKPKMVGVFVREKTGHIVDTLVGRLLICRHDDDGDSTACRLEDLDYVSTHVVKRTDTNIEPIWVDDFGRFEVSDYLLVLLC